jgi:hypothetical protein
MNNLPTPPAPLQHLPPVKQVPHGQRRTSGVAITSLVLSILWIAGIGSVAAIILGFISQRRTKRSAGAKGAADVATAGIVIGVAGLVFSVVFWMLLVGGSGGNTMTSSPSYVDGSNFATANYANATAESAVCTPSNISSGDRATLWMRGCQDGWATAKYSINNNSGAGLNIGNYSP